jgi:hypothetical protein
MDQRTQTLRPIARWSIRLAALICLGFASNTVAPNAVGAQKMSTASYNALVAAGYF